jgi:hypothetical protein
MWPVSRISHELREVDVNQKGNQLRAGEFPMKIWVLTDGSKNEGDMVAMKSGGL